MLSCSKNSAFLRQGGGSTQPGPSSTMTAIRTSARHFYCLSSISHRLHNSLVHRLHRDGAEEHEGPVSDGRICISLQLASRDQPDDSAAHCCCLAAALLLPCFHAQRPGPAGRAGRSARVPPAPAPPVRRCCDGCTCANRPASMVSIVTMLVTYYGALTAQSDCVPETVRDLSAGQGPGLLPLRARGTADGQPPAAGLAICVGGGPSRVFPD